MTKPTQQKKIHEQTFVLWCGNHTTEADAIANNLYTILVCR